MLLYEHIQFCYHFIKAKSKYKKYEGTREGIFYGCFGWKPSESEIQATTLEGYFSMTAWLERIITNMIWHCLWT